VSDSVSPARVIFLVDVDNTLLDNDRLIADLMDHIASEYGAVSQQRYAQILEEVRGRLGYVDYLGALQRYRVEHQDDMQLLQVSLFLLDYPFAQRLYPGALAALARCRALGPTVLLTDGDVVFQPRKVQRSGLWEAVEGRVLIYVHKEQMLAAVARRFPAAHYVMIDDKIRILDAIKKAWGERVTTIMPRQGHYALDTAAVASYPPADVTVERIADLLERDFGSLCA